MWGGRKELDHTGEWRPWTHSVTLETLENTVSAFHSDGSAWLLCGGFSVWGNVEAGRAFGEIWLWPGKRRRTQWSNVGYMSESKPPWTSYAWKRSRIRSNVGAFQVQQTCCRWNILPANPQVGTVWTLFYSWESHTFPGARKMMLQHISSRGWLLKTHFLSDMKHWTQDLPATSLPVSEKEKVRAHFRSGMYTRRELTFWLSPVVMHYGS